MWHSAKLRAKRKNLEFSIAVEDILIPITCPVLGIPLNIEKFGVRYDSPSLDRRNSSLGYTKENIWVISSRANLLKNNASVDELYRLVRGLKKCGLT